MEHAVPRCAARGRLVRGLPGSRQRKPVERGARSPVGPERAHGRTDRAERLPRKVPSRVRGVPGSTRPLCRAHAAGVRMIAAVIPTLYRPPTLGPLMATLAADGVEVI